MGLFSKLRFKIALMAAVLLAGLSFLTLFFVSGAIDRQSTGEIKDQLGFTALAFEGKLHDKQDSMRAQGLVLADSVQFKTALDDKTQDPATAADVAQEKRRELGLDLFQIAGRKGALLASLVGAVNTPQPKPGKDAKPADPIFAKATDSEDPADAFGAWAAPDMVFETYTRPIIIRDQVLGGLRIGFAMNDAFAQALHKQTDTEVAVVSGGKVLASSLDDAARKVLEAGMASMQGMAKSAGETGVFEVALKGVPYLGQFIPLKGPDGAVAADLLQLRSRASVLQLLSRIRSTFFGVFGSLLLVAVALSIFFAGTITKPLNALVAGTRAVEKGNLDYSIPVTTKDELGELAESFNEMVTDLKEKERVKAVFGRYLPKAVADRAMQHQGDLGLGGEEREVAVLFSDIRGFTSLSERLSPPEVVKMLNEYYTRMIDVLFENDGTLDKTIGDAIMAVFGAPVSDPESTAKALKTALGMMAELKKFNAERVARGEEPVQIGIGVNTGTVVAGNLGSVKQLSYTVIGDEVNLASRMCSNAKAGQILVTDATYRKTKWLFEFNQLEPIKVKNVSNPVQVYEVLGLREQPQTQS
jgi:class 3 adenylate cyclase